MSRFFSFLKKRDTYIKMKILNTFGNQSKCGWKPLYVEFYPNLKFKYDVYRG